MSGTKKRSARPHQQPTLPTLAPSRNAADRSTNHTKAVLSLRILGADIDRLDVEAARITKQEQRAPWNKANRTTVIQRALADYFAKHRKG